MSTLDAVRWRHTGGSVFAALCCVLVTGVTLFVAPLMSVVWLLAVAGSMVSLYIAAVAALNIREIRCAADTLVYSIKPFRHPSDLVCSRVAEGTTLRVALNQSGTAIALIVVDDRGKATELASVDSEELAWTLAEAVASRVLVKRNENAGQPYS